MRTTMIDGTKVKVGDWVGFKSYHEQSGQIIAIKKNHFGNIELTLHNPDGFSGEYIRGMEFVTEWADRCWVD